MLIEQIIARTIYPEVQKQLQAKEKKITQEKTIQMVKNHKASINFMKQLQSTRNQNVQHNATVDSIQNTHKNRRNEGNYKQ